MQETTDILTAEYKRDYLSNEATSEDLIFMGSAFMKILNSQEKL